MEVWAAGQCIGLVLFSWEMDKGEVVISKVGNLAGYLSVNVLWVVVIFEVLVVCVDCDWVRGAHQEVAPVGEATHESK